MTVSETLRELLELRALSRKETPRADAVMVSPDTLGALLDIAESADELRLWEPGRKGYAAAQRRVFDALDIPAVRAALEEQVTLSRTRDGAHLLRVHESMLAELSEAWSRPFQLRLGVEHRDGTRDLETRPAEDTDATSLRAMLDRVIDAGVETWHTVVNDEPSLSAWLGLTDAEYSEWVSPNAHDSRAASHSHAARITGEGDE